mmetsp:Transcript_46466/g.61561  ORF Transcript_46466/g.61561 Transcript_46466/m.61561 type:complete len:118 (-) Transcript_46466:539-892(-)
MISARKLLIVLVRVESLQVLSQKLLFHTCTLSVDRRQVGWQLRLADAFLIKTAVVTTTTTESVVFPRVQGLWLVPTAKEIAHFARCGPHKVHTVAVVVVVLACGDLWVKDLDGGEFR